MSNNISMVDTAQIIKYRKMLGLTNLQTSDTLVDMLRSTTIMNILHVEQDTITNNNVTIYNNLNITNNLKNTKHVLCRGYLQSDNIEINNPVTSTGNIKSSNILIEGNINLKKEGILKSINIDSGNLNDISYFKNSINVNNIMPINNTINIISDTINIGNSNTTLDFRGIEINFNAVDTKMYDNILTLNANIISTSNSDTYIGRDKGNNAGFIIKSNSGDGYILTNDDCKRLKIKAPRDPTYRYIATTDIDNNFIISGNTELHGANTIGTNLVVSGDTTIFGNTNFNSSMNLSGNTIFNNNVSILSELNLLGNMVINNKTTLLSSLNIMGEATFKTTTVNSTFNINGDTLIYGSLTTNSIINMYGESIFQGSTTLFSDINIKRNLLITGDTTILSSINIIDNCIIGGNMYINNDLIISNKSKLEGNTTLLSTFNVGGDVIINGNMSIGSLLMTAGFFDNYSPSELNSFEILGKIICNLPEYENNAVAILAGMPLWSFYRTGGILKIRLDDKPPVIVLRGDTNVFVKITNLFVDPGAYATDNVNNNIKIYLYSIHNLTTSNIVTTPYLITSNTTVINTSQLSLGSYIISYKCMDSEGNETTIERILYIISESLKYNYSLINIEQSNVNSAYTIGNNNLIVTNVNYTGVSFTFNRTLMQNIDFNLQWSFIVKLRSLSWGNIFQINFDPTFNLWNSNSSNSVHLDSGISNIEFRQGSKYFYSTDSFWGPVAYNQNFYDKINNNNGVYIKIYRNNDGKIGIIIYDHTGGEIENVTTIYPINYIIQQSFCTFTSLVDLEWFHGFIIHTSDAGATVEEFKTYFEN